MNRRAVRFTATLLTIIATLLLAVGVQPAAAQSGPEPGTTDPLSNPSRYFLLRDDEVFNPGEVQPLGYGATQFNWSTSFADPDLQFNRQVTNYDGTTIIPEQNADAQVWTASGRILASAYDQVVTLFRRGDGLMSLYFVDSATADAPQYSANFPTIANRDFASSDLIDVAVGELDKLVDSKGDYHDEVAVAYASGDPSSGYQINLAVLDYASCSGSSSAAPCGRIEVQTSHSVDPINTASSWLPGYLLDNIIGTAIGDFDGNGVDEIAVAYLQNQNTLWISTFRYTNDGKGNRTLTEVASASSGPGGPPPTGFSGTVSLQAGDFDGSSDNDDELIVGGFQFLGDPSSNTSVELVGYVTTVSLNNALTPTFVSDGAIAEVEYSAAPGRQPPRMQLAAGLFKFDPAAGYTFGRRQFAAAYNTADSDDTLRIQAFTVGTDLSYAPLWGPITPLLGSLPIIGQKFSIAAGGYRGVQGASNPIWGLAYIGNSQDGDDNGNTEYIGMIDGATGTVTQNGPTVVNLDWSPNIRTELVAYDYDGDSIYLGTPVHYTVDNNINTDFVLQEPPKHAYYDNNPQSSTYGQVVTVSRKDAFNVSLQDSSKTTFSSTSTDTVSSSIGQSTAGSASATVGVNENFGVAKVSASVTASFAQTSSYTNQQTRADNNSQYGSRTVSFGGATNRDDYLSGRTQIIDVWRYRVFGLAIPPSGNTQPNGYYDIVLPGPVETFAGAGQSFDWYQPLHENGNILSYPSELGSNNLPVDLGVYTDTTGAIVQQPLVPASLQAFDGTSGTVAIAYSSTSGAGYIQGYSHSQKASTDVGVAAKVSAEAFGVSGTVNTAVKAQWSNQSSASESTTSNQTTGTSTGITLNKPAGNGNQGYTFSPVFYITQDGTVKAAHSASVLGSASGQPFWAALYGAKADPALNLPGRFNPVLDQNSLIGWQPDTGTLGSRNSSRKQLRGFALTDATPNPVSGSYDYLAYAPAAGDNVRVATNVYNYSTGVTVSNLVVQFQAIPYNAADDVETRFTNCPNGLQLTDRGRCVIGQTTVAALGVAGAINATTAAVTWDTTSFGPGTASPTGQYRIYAVLDPNNTIQEIYETENPDTVYPWTDTNGNAKVLPRGVDPGQNNEGYGLASVTAAGSTLQAAPPADVYLQADSLAVLDARTLRPSSDGAQVNVGETARVRLTLYSDLAQREFNDVQIYDGDPAKGGTLIAQKRVFAGDPDGASVWFNWLPETAGQHTLYAKLLNDHDDPNATNGTDTLNVTVTAQRYRTFTPLLVKNARVTTMQ